jgi:tRNA-dihydrouridine synthase B
MRIGSDEQPVGIQLFGANPESMCRAAQLAAAQFRPALIDINLGCPVKKVVAKNGGAAILKDPRLTHDIIAATVSGAGGLPVTVKMRTGWDDANPVYLETAEIARQAGAEAVTLHARSRAKGYSGRADWAAIRKLKETVSITVIGNGDVFTALDAARMIDETGCDGVMIGRAAMANPLIFRQVNHYLSTGRLLPEPTVQERIHLARVHARMVVRQFGEGRGIKMMRHHLSWYSKGLPGASQLRPRLFQVSSLRDIDELLAAYSTAQGIDGKCRISGEERR